MTQTSSTIHRNTLPIMAHLVLGYPSLPESLRTAEKYIAAGVEVLELQIPFSHPTADGPVITAACQQAVANGVSVQHCLDAIEMLRNRFPDQQIIVMSYLNRIYTFGFQQFIQELERLGIGRVIIPDLPVDSLLGRSAFAGNTSSVQMTPVLAANTSSQRLEKLLDLGFDFFYLMSDFKITGSGFSLHPRLQAIIDQIRAHPPGESSSPRTIGIGFGISTPQQVQTVSKVADLAIVGSALIEAQKDGRLEEYLESLRQVFIES